MFMSYIEYLNLCFFNFLKGNLLFILLLHFNNFAMANCSRLIPNDNFYHHKRIIF